ncbi:hypothetical protein [Fodinicola feengrottensis]|uniref:hypothetical protein n=1 Tax=Fodinicola feengrottensis TaxID=435914 RepID=UPI0024428673|nr:hypothetical protein [Fodinicola feengrottensis]
MIPVVLVKPPAYHRRKIIGSTYPCQAWIDRLRGDFFKTIRKIVQMIGNFP